MCDCLSAGRTGMSLLVREEEREGRENYSSGFHLEISWGWQKMDLVNVGGGGGNCRI